MNKVFFLPVPFCLLLFFLIPNISSCGKMPDKESIKEYTVIFDVMGGKPAPLPLKITEGGKIPEPEMSPSKEGWMFAGWYDKNDKKYDFVNAVVYEDMTLFAKWWHGPEQFIFINSIDVDFQIDKIRNWFGSQTGKKTAVGESFIIYCFERPRNVLMENLNKHLAQSEMYDIPVLVQLDAITFMNARPDLWNWWDESKPGYDPANRENVEWTSWSSADAVKIGWLNWGTQIRLNPMPNLMSARYREAVKQQMSEFIARVLEWVDNLPADKKWLFAGIKSTGEIYLGVNNWHYPDGNNFIDKDPSQDPQYGVNVYDLPSRGVQTIGYAALKTGGIKTNGSITGDDIALLAQKHSEFASKICFDSGIPRDKIFVHAAGVDKELSACVNVYACPSWSFYGQEADNPAGFSAVLAILSESDAPYFGIAEWSIGGSVDKSKWTSSIRKGLSIPKCRFLSIYDNVVGNIYNTSANQAAIEGIKSLQ
jgi:uncharacterized repeat protein (TIGR02543 family)